MVSAMKAGVVWANTFNRFDPTSPFGGYKESGFGREGLRWAIEDMTELRIMVLAWPQWGRQAPVGQFQ